MLKKINLGDLVLDYSEEGVENIGYIYNIHTDNDLPKTNDYKTLYQVYWLSPDPAEGDYFSLKEINKWITEGTWKYFTVKKNERKTKK